MFWFRTFLTVVGIAWISTVFNWPWHVSAAIGLIAGAFMGAIEEQRK